MIDEIVGMQGWEMLLDRARLTQLQKQTRIIQGKCKDYEEYVKECAFTDGMEFLTRLPQRLHLELEMALAERILEPEDDEKD